MNHVSQLAWLQMNWQDQFAWAAPPVGITLVASLILFGIWRRGIPHGQRGAQKTTISRDDGVMWMFLACTGWCFTAVVQAVKLFKTGNLRLDDPTLTFMFVLFSVTNSLFFILATANLDAMTTDSSFVATLLKGIRQKSTTWWVLGGLILITFLLRFGFSDAIYYKGFDVIVSMVTIFLIIWGFIKSFWKRGMPVVALLTIPVFLLFTFSQVGDFLRLLTPTLNDDTRNLFRVALSATSDGMVSLIFIALTFSWVHERAEGLADTIVKIPVPILVPMDKPTPALSPTGTSKQAEAEDLAVTIADIPLPILVPMDKPTPPGNPKGSSKQAGA